MKIYFEDGPLLCDSVIPFEVDSIINASAGVSWSIHSLNYLLKRNPNAIVYTNSIFAFSNQYAWNKELKVPEIYIRPNANSSFVRIDQLTTRELREGYNLAKMYVAGEFDIRSDS